MTLQLPRCRAQFCPDFPFHVLASLTFFTTEEKAGNVAVCRSCLNPSPADSCEPRRINCCIPWIYAFCCAVRETCHLASTDQGVRLPIDPWMAARGTPDYSPLLLLLLHFKLCLKGAMTPTTWKEGMGRERERVGRPAVS